MSDSVSIACAGDVLVTRRLGALVRTGCLDDLRDSWADCHVRFANLETLFHDYEDPAMPDSGGTWVRSAPAIAHELRAIGVDMVSNANNHSGDYAWPALLRTCRVLDDADIVHAGAGPDLDSARAAGYAETGRARIAVLAATATFPSHAKAGRAYAAVPARPGISYLRYDVEHRVPEADFHRMRALAERFTPQEDAARVTLDSTTFVPGDGYARITRAVDTDLREIACAVGEARQVADLVAVGLHSHEPGADWDQPAGFLIAAAHTLVDAGADLVVCNGPHMVAGIERWGTGIVLYGLGSLFFQNNTVVHYPADARLRAGLPPDASNHEINATKWDFARDDRYWETMVARCCWKDGRPVGVELRPLALRRSPAALQGLPYRPDEGRCRKILDRVAELSRPFGTEVAVAANGRSATVTLDRA